jgi:hypothetical protein
MADDSAAPPRATERTDHRIALGLALTALWLALALAYVGLGLGWRAFLALPPGEIGSLLEGAVSPLAFLWLVLGLFLQQSELNQNSRALAIQSEALMKSAEQAEIQARAIHANELHARQDTFVDLYQLVNRQLGVVAALLYMSSQAQNFGGDATPERTAEMWTQLGTGDSEVFIRGLLGAGVRLEPREVHALFFGTATRARHAETFVATFERLLRNADACDPEGLIRDAILGNGSGRLYSLIARMRNEPPVGAAIVPAG